MSEKWVALSTEPVDAGTKIYTQMHSVQKKSRIAPNEEDTISEKGTSSPVLSQLVTAIMVEFGPKSTVHSLRSSVELLPKVHDSVVSRIHRNFIKDEALIYTALVCDFSDISIVPFLQSIDSRLELATINSEVIPLLLGKPTSNEAKHMDENVVESLSVFNEGFKNVALFDLLAFYAIGVPKGYSSVIAQYVLSLVNSMEPAKRELKNRPRKMVDSEQVAAQEFVAKTNTHVLRLRHPLPLMNSFKKGI